MSTNYTLERSIINDDNWEHYADLGCDENTAIEMWHYWQEKQPSNKFRMYKVTKELVAMSSADPARQGKESTCYSTFSNGEVIAMSREYHDS